MTTPLTAEIDRLRDELRIICGAFWRLDKYGHIADLNADDDEHNAQASHWIELARGVVQRNREADGTLKREIQERRKRR